MKNPTKRSRVPKFQGVYSRESTTRRHLGKPDKCFDICYRNPKGKLVWEKVGWLSEGYTAVMASTIRGERIRSIRHGDEIVQKKNREPTLGEVWEKYDQWLETAKRRPSDDRFLYKKHLQSPLADKLLSQITPFDLEKMKIAFTKKGLAPASVKHYLVLVRQIINKAIAWGMWKGENPVKKVKMPKLNNRRERFLSVEEAQRLLDYLSEANPQTHDMSLLSLHTGMRAGEIFKLRWVHIDFDNGLIHVADPKNKARKAFMTPTVKEMFNKRTPGQPEEFVFKSKKGDQIKEISMGFSREIKKIGFNEGITDRRQKVSFHTLRHTFASWLAIQGTPILTIKELLGHQTLVMTERYSHLIPDQKRQAVEGIEKVFRAGVTRNSNEVPKTIDKDTLMTNPTQR